MSTMNRLANCKNPYQGNFKKVLCVCSAGLLRSPTAAVVLSQPPFNYNTRAAGENEEYALIPVDRTLLTWADEIVCMEAHQKHNIGKLLARYDLDRKITCLDIPDNFEYRNGELMRLIAQKYEAAHGS